jgi:hypothetical protein
MRPVRQTTEKSDMKQSLGKKMVGEAGPPATLKTLHNPRRTTEKRHIDAKQQFETPAAPWQPCQWAGFRRAA